MHKETFSAAFRQTTGVQIIKLYPVHSLFSQVIYIYIYQCNYMCVFKVADRRNSGKSPTPRDEGLYRINGLESVLGPMFTGHNREEEMAVMVSALTHVVSGGTGGSEGDSTAEYMWEGGGGGVGEKRGRGDESGVDGRVCRANGDFSIGVSNNIRGK